MVIRPNQGPEVVKEKNSGAYNYCYTQAQKLILASTPTAKEIARSRAAAPGAYCAVTRARVTNLLIR
jgi:hypothetical protein